MFAGAHVLAFAVTAAILIAIPGPSVLFTVGRALALGRRAALATVAGNTLGLLVMGLVSAAGLGAVLQESVTVLGVVKVAGGLYLVYLGIQAFRHRGALVATTGGVVLPDVPLRRSVREGFVVGVTNPKAVVIFTAVMPPFVDRDGGPFVVQLLVLTLVAVTIGFLSDSCWALAAGSARDWFARSPRRSQRLGAAGGVAMVAVGVRVAVAR